VARLQIRRLGNLAVGKHLQTERDYRGDRLTTIFLSHFVATTSLTPHHDGKQAEDRGENDTPVAGSNAVRHGIDPG
jgi:hypothetical protein